MAHAFLSPSSASRAYKCPASALRSFQVEQRMELLRQVGVEFYGLTEKSDIARLNTVLKDENQAANDGTLLHKVFEDCIEKRPTDKNLVQQMMVAQGVSEGIANDVYLVDVFHKLLLEQYEILNTAQWYECEKRIKIKGLPQFGTLDLCFGIEDTLYVRDLKTGYNEVVSENNEQLMTYTVGLLDALGWDRFKEIKILILGVRWQAKEWTTTPEEMLEFKNEVMLPAFMDAYSINPTAKAGEHCRYCSAKISCKEWQDKFDGMMNKTIDGFDVKEADTKHLVSMFKLVKQAEALGKQLSSEILHRFEGFDIPTGIRRVNGAKIRKWDCEEEDVIKAFKGKVNKNMLYKQTLLSPKDMQVVIGDEKAVENLSSMTIRKPYLKV